MEHTHYGTVGYCSPAGEGLVTALALGAVPRRIVTTEAGMHYDRCLRPDIVDHLVQDESQLAQQAILSELVYTLAIAAVLTKGDLPVDMVQPPSQSVTA